MKKNRIVGCISLLLGIVVYFMTRQIPDSTMLGDPGSRLFPYISVFLFVVCGIGLCFSRDKDEEEMFLEKGQWIRLIIMLGVMLAYFLLVDIVGFIPLSVVFLFLISTMFAEGQDVIWWKRLTFAIVVTIILYLVFTKVLAVPLPAGFCAD